MTNSNDKYENERSTLGKFFYTFVTNASIYIGKHKSLYYTLNYTWGIIMTLIGWFVSFCLLSAGVISTKYHKSSYQLIGKSWGGLTLGMNIFTDKKESEYVIMHEYGHTHQNAVLGPFFIFLVAIPSAIRYWYREIKKISEPSYYAIWFEGSASDIGEAVLEYEKSIEEEEDTTEE